MLLQRETSALGTARRLEHREAQRVEALQRTLRRSEEAARQLKRPHKHSHRHSHRQSDVQLS